MEVEQRETLDNIGGESLEGSGFEMEKPAFEQELTFEASTEQHGADAQ